MADAHYKIFKEKNQDLSVVSMGNEQYYSFLRIQSEKGLRQFLLTSDLLISVAINITKQDRNELIKVDLFDDEDQGIATEIVKNFNYLKNNILTVEDIKYKLSFLNSENSIDILGINFMNEIYGEFKLNANGIITVEAEISNELQKEITDLILDTVVNIWRK